MLPVSSWKGVAIGGSPKAAVCSSRSVRTGGANQAAIALISVLAKAGISSGMRRVIRLPAWTTSLSSQCAPAFSRSARSAGHEVILRPLTSAALISAHGPWQIGAIGYVAVPNALTNVIVFGSSRRLSGLIMPPGSTSAP